MKTRALLATLAALTLATAVGCSSGTESTSDVDQGAVELAHPEVDGSFSVPLKAGGETYKVKFSFKMSEIDLHAKTVLWNAKITDRAGHPNLWDDENVAGKVTRVARCPGCFTAEMPGSNGHPLAVVNVDDWKVTSIKYENVDARLLADEAPEPGGGGSSSTTGACIMNGGACWISAADKCNNQGIPPEQPRPRCCTTFEFKAGEACPR
ncbi:MAG: hypothetical protein IPG50_13330 [Myxococcales bacterium]|nr:hypothetical protein [Myxococcales bacterium]